MEFNFVRNKINNGYITLVDPKSKPRILCFKTKPTATICLKHLAKFKADYGIWPPMDLSSNKVNIVNKEKSNKRNVLEFENQLEINTLDIEELNEIGLTTNTSFLYCHTFGILLDDMDCMSVSFSGQEIDSEPDNLLYVNSLNRQF